MSKSDALALGARFVAAFCDATRGRPNTFRRIADVAWRARFNDGAQIEFS